MPNDGRDLNVILFPPDTVRRDHLSCYGYPRETTPHLDHMAREGVVFADHVANAGWTQPQYMTIHTGMYPLTHGVNRIKFVYPLSPKLTNLAEVLRAQGYATGAATSANWWIHPKMGYGRGFDEYIWGLGNNRATDVIFDEALKWIEEVGARRKFFCFIHSHDTHEPFNPPAPYGTLWGDEYVDRYDGEITWVDHHLGRLLNKLEEMGIRENTLVIYSADHGTEFFEHGFLEKAINLYNEIIHIPLVMSCPAVLPQQRIVRGLNGSIDVVPTILDILGLPPKRDADGRSLLPLVVGEPGAQGREAVFSHTAHMSRRIPRNTPCFEHLSVHTETHKFIRAKILQPFTEEYFEVVDKNSRAGAAPHAASYDWMARFQALAERVGMNPGDIRQGTVFRELFDLSEDPGEQRNVITEQAELAVQLEGQLNAWLEQCTAKHNDIYQGQYVYMEMPARYHVSLKTSEDFEASRLVDGLEQDFVPSCPVPVRINAGGPKYVDRQGREWMADQAYHVGKWGYLWSVDSGDVVGTSKTIRGTDDPGLYLTQRFGRRFTYQFDVPNGEYRVKLHFAETLMEVGLEAFDVSIRGDSVLSGYSIFSDAGGMNVATTKSFTCTVDDSADALTRLTIDFRGAMDPQQEAAKVAAIEILHMGE